MQIKCCEMKSSFTPMLWYVCRLCRQAFPDVEKLVVHKELKHLENYEKLKCIIFEERLLDPECVAPDNPFAQRDPDSRCENEIGQEKIFCHCNCTMPVTLTSERSQMQVPMGISRDLFSCSNPNVPAGESELVPVPVPDQKTVPYSLKVEDDQYQKPMSKPKLNPYVALKKLTARELNVALKVRSSSEVQLQPQSVPEPEPEPESESELKMNLEAVEESESVVELNNISEPETKHLHRSPKKEFNPEPIVNLKKNLEPELENKIDLQKTAEPEADFKADIKLPEKPVRKFVFKKKPVREPEANPDPPPVVDILEDSEDEGFVYSPQRKRRCIRIIDDGSEDDQNPSNENDVNHSIPQDFQLNNVIHVGDYEELALSDITKNSEGKLSFKIRVRQDLFLEDDDEEYETVEVVDVIRSNVGTSKSARSQIGRKRKKREMEDEKKNPNSIRQLTKRGRKKRRRRNKNRRLRKKLEKNGPKSSNVKVKVKAEKN